MQRKAHETNIYPDPHHIYSKERKINMNNGNQHQMVMKNSFPSGAQEWYCPTCGRHFIIQWPPNYKRIILDEGDKQAGHAGGTDGLTMGPMDITQMDKTAGQAGNQDTPGEPGGNKDLDDPYLSPWARWMEDKNI